MEQSAPSRTSTPAADGVRVSVRIRPLNAREKAAAQTAGVSWNITNASVTQCVADRPVAANSFAFDHVFEQGTTNDQVFDALAKPVVASATEGINGVIFAYGQTAAGKTYTMLGTEEDPGVTRRSIAAVFEHVAATTNRAFLLRASYIEIYNEVIRDLLAPDNDNLKIHEDVLTKRVFVDSHEEVVTSVGQVMDIITGGETVRAVGETNMNDRSSRSHTIFSLKIESRELKVPEAGEDSPVDDGVAVRASSLSLVDLAGSERASFTKAQGMRLVEGGHINKSLLTLGTVINKLSSGEVRSAAHIPYRDSKLTRLLQPALGGNARTAIVCAITPAILHMEETLSTLKFASRAKKVTNNAKTNEFLDDRAKLRRAEKEVAFLKNECQRLRSGGRYGESRTSLQSGDMSTGSCEDASKRVAAFSEKFERMVQYISTDRDSEFGPHPGVRARLDMGPPRLAHALDLCLARRHDCHRDSNFDSHTEAVVADLRKKVFNVEAQMRQSVSEMNYERKAMDAEIEAMVLAAEESDRARRSAEYECGQINHVLSKSQMSSFVDEIVAETMAVSLASTELCKANEQLARLGDVAKKNEQMAESLASLKKEHAEMVKRERRGVGPVLKKVKYLEGKLADLEKKSKSLRQISAKSSSEKAALERTVKEKERQNRVLSGEVEKHRNYVAKGQARVSKEVAEEKRKYEIALQQVRDLNEELKGVVKEKNEELASASEQLSRLDAELADIMRANSKLNEEYDILKLRCLELEENVEVFRTGSDSLKQIIVDLQQSEASNAQIASELTEELGKTHLELEGTRSELAQVSQEVESLASQNAELQDTAREVLQRKEDMEEKLRSSEKELERLIAKRLEAKAGEDTALNAARELSAEASSLKVTIESLECDRDTSRAEKEALTAQLSEATKKLEEQKGAVSELTELLRETERAHQVDQKDLQAELSKMKQSAHEQAMILEANSIVGTDTKGAGRDEGLDSPQKRQRLSSLETAVRQMRVDLDYANGQRERLENETIVRTREVGRLLETIQARDHRLYKLQDQLNKIERGEGPVAVLESRVHKRDLVIGELNEKLKVQETFLSANGVTAEARDIADLAAKAAGLSLDLRRHETLVSRYEKERTAMIEESRKLRDRLKDKDMQQVMDNVKKKETRQKTRSKAEVLKPRPLNAATDQT